MIKDINDFGICYDPVEDTLHVGGVKISKPENSMKPTNYKAPSAKALVDVLNITPEQAATARGLIRGEVRTKDAERFPKANAYFQSCHHEPGRLTRILECLNEVLEMHGVEILGECRTYGPPAEYLNAGDTYTATLLFDHIAGNFKLTSWGDWYEKNENKPAFKNW